MAFNLGALLNPGNTYFNGGSHQVNNFPGTSLFGTHKKTDLDDTNTSAGQTIDSNHDGKYTAGTDKVLAMDLNHDGKITRSDLTGTKSVYLTKFLMSNEQTSGQAGMLATAQLLGGDWKLARTLPERIRAVTPAGVQAFAKKYMGRLQFTVLGDPAKVDKGLFTSM